MTEKTKRTLSEALYATSLAACGIGMGIAICVGKTGVPFKMGPIVITTNK